MAKKNVHIRSQNESKFILTYLREVYLLQLLARKSTKYYFGKKSAKLAFYISPPSHCAYLTVHMEMAWANSCLLRKDLAVITKKLHAQPNRLSPIG